MIVLNNVYDVVGCCICLYYKKDDRQMFKMLLVVLSKVRYELLIVLNVYATTEFIEINILNKNYRKAFTHSLVGSTFYQKVLPTEFCTTSVAL